MSGNPRSGPRPIGATLAAAQLQKLVTVEGGLSCEHSGGELRPMRRVWSTVTLFNGLHGKCWENAGIRNFYVSVVMYFFWWKEWEIQVLAGRSL